MKRINRNLLKNNICLIVHDNGSYIHYFPLGTAYLAAILRERGHKVTIFHQDVYHYSEQTLTEFLDNNKFDVVGIGTVAGYYPYRKLLRISEAINKSINRKNFQYVLGGHMPSASPEYFLLKTGADFVLKGEGELTFIDMLDKLPLDRPIKDIPGLVARFEKTIYTAPERELIQDLDTLPFPAFDLFPINYYKLQRLPNISPTEFSMSILSGRGCSYHCNFCYRLMPGFRLRSINKIVEEIQLLKDGYNISYIDFADDLTMASKQRALELSDALRPLNIKWRCEGRLNYVDNEILKAMKSAGCVFINYGIESLDNTVLKNMKKALTKEIIIKGIEKTLEIGISPGLNIIWGNIGDTVATLNESVEFLLKYDDGAQTRTIRPVTPYPGCELFTYALEKGLLKDVEDFYENKHVNSDLLSVNFTDLTDDEFYMALYKANQKLLNNYIQKQTQIIDSKLHQLYIKKDSTFRGFRQT